MSALQPQKRAERSHEFPVSRAQRPQQHKRQQHTQTNARALQG